MSRSGYLIAIVGITTLCGFAFAAGQRNPSVALGAAAAFLAVPLIFTVLRLNNIGLSGWWSLLALVPGLNLLVTGACLVLPAGYRYERRLDVASKVGIGLLALAVGSLAGAWPFLSRAASRFGGQVKSRAEQVIVPLSTGGSPVEVFGWSVAETVATESQVLQLSGEDGAQGLHFVIADARIAPDLLGLSPGAGGNPQASLGDFKLLSTDGSTSTATAVSLLAGAADEGATLDRLSGLPLRPGSLVITRSAGGATDQPVWCRALFRGRPGAAEEAAPRLLLKERNTADLLRSRQR